MSYPKDNGQPGWPIILEVDGDRYVRLRDASYASGDKSISNICLYGKIIEGAKPTIDNRTMWSPKTGPEGEIRWMTPGEWVKNETLEASKVPLYEVPDLEEILKS